MEGVRYSKPKKHLANGRTYNMAIWPFKTDYKKGKTLSQIAAGWLNGVSTVLNELKVSHGYIRRGSNLHDWTIELQVVPVNFISGFRWDDDTLIAITQTVLVVGTPSDDIDQDLTDTEFATLADVDFIKDATYDANGCLVTFKIFRGTALMKSGAVQVGDESTPPV